MYLGFSLYPSWPRCNSPSGNAGKAHPHFGSIEMELESRVF